MEGSRSHCNFWIISKMGLCGKRQIWDKARLPPFRDAPKRGWALKYVGGEVAGKGRILWHTGRATLPR